MVKRCRSAATVIYKLREVYGDDESVNVAKFREVLVQGFAKAASGISTDMSASM